MSRKSDSAIEQKLVQFAEQLGHVVGTVQAKADGWLDRETLRGQIAGVRDAASALLGQVSAPPRRPPTSRSGTAARTKATGGTKGAPRKQAASGRGAVDAPGKRHRKPLPSAKGVKHSDERVAKLRVAAANRQRRRG